MTRGTCAQDSQPPFIHAFAQYAAGRASRILPEDARKLAVDAITDAVACMFAGSATPGVEMLRSILPTSQTAVGNLIAPCPATRLYASSADAALLGATMADAIDFSDINHPGHAHPSAVLVPTLLAVAAHASASGHDFVDAYVCGLELIGKLGRILNPSHFEKGWHPTGTLGPLGAAAAAAVLLRLNENQIVTALAIAASGAAGLRANFGTMVKPLHAGQSARTGVVAALLARAGYTASPDALDHIYGYFSCFSGPDGHVSPSRFQPGESLEILSDHGLALKAFPSCGASHPAIEAALEVRGQLAPSEIQDVFVTTSTLTLKALIHDRPVTGLQAKFSLPFCVAAALVEGRVGIATFDTPCLADPLIRTMMGKIHVGIDDEFRNSSEFGARIRLVMQDGRQLEHAIAIARGKPARRLTTHELEEKFYDCTAGTLDDVGRQALYQSVRQVDSDMGVNDFALLVSRGGLSH